MLRAWSLGEARSRWQLKAAFGVATALVLAHGLGFPRPMWMGIAAMSVLLPSRQAIPGRVKGRIWGNLAGGAGFCLLYCLLPGSLLPYLGIFGGIGVGLSVTYGWQAVFNSLGAMSIMVGTLGLPGVVLFRVSNNAPGRPIRLGRGPAGRPLAGAAARRQLNAVQKRRPPWDNGGRRCLCLRGGTRSGFGGVGQGLDEAVPLVGVDLPADDLFL